MKASHQWGRIGGILILGLATLEIIIMISPFAGFFYASLRFEPLLGVLGASAATAWLDGFFLNHSVVTTSTLLEVQRKVGEWLFALGLWGFIISACQVYGNKIFKRGVASGFLYRYLRHPQYFCLSVAGWGLLTMWPRFLLLGLWVTMLFLYEALSRFEEYRMTEKYGDSYTAYAEGRDAFLPGAPVQKLFDNTFGRLGPKPVAWGVAYVFCLTVAFSLAFAARAYTRNNSVYLEKPAEHTVAISVWPQPKEWVERIHTRALAREDVRARVAGHPGEPVIATILPAKYVMTNMYYKLTPEDQARRPIDLRLKAGIGPWWQRTIRIVAGSLLPFLRPPDFMGVDPDLTDTPVDIVFSRAAKPFKSTLPFDETLDPGVKMTPLAIVRVVPTAEAVADVLIPLPQNAFGPNVTMPIF